MTETSNKPSRIVKICEKISKISIYLLVFLLPIFFLPWTVNVLDFNKQALLIVLVFVSLFAWLLKNLISGKLTLNLGLIHIPIVVLFLVFLFSTIFSSWPYGSFWGWPQVTSEGLITLLCFVLLYFLVTNIFEKKEIFYLTTLLILSSFLAILYGIFQLFGKFLLPFNFTKTISFNTIGAVNSLSIFIAVLLPLFITYLTINIKKYFKVFFLIAIFLSAILLLLINFPIAWWVVIAGSALLITFGAQKRDFFDNRWLVLPMFFLALALFFTFFKFQIPGLPDRPIEVFLTQKASFDISLKTLKENPALGSGPGTFIYDFSKHKNISFNQSPFWDIRFNSAGTKFLNILATAGILGALSFIALLFLFIIYGLKSLFAKKIIKVKVKSSRITSEESLLKSEKGLNEQLLWNIGFGVFISFIAISFVFFFYDSSLSLDFVYFLLIAVSVSIFSSAKKEFLLKPSSLINLGVTFIFTIVFIFGLAILIFAGQRYLAEINYLKGVQAWQQGKGEVAISYLAKATGINPRSDLYWRELAQAYIQNVDLLAGRTDLSREEITQKIQIFVNNAVNSAKTATDVNPINVANWSVRGFVYQSLVEMVPGASEWAKKIYEEALKLEPINPYFPTQAGITLLREVAFLTQDRDQEREKILGEAEGYFKKAIELKSDYAPARFQLAMVYQAQGKAAEAIEELERTKNIAPFDVGLAFQLGLTYYQNKDYQKARAELERAVLLNSNYSNALYFLGLTLEQLGEKEKAIEMFERVAALNPGNAQVHQILENLKSGNPALKGMVEEEPPVVPIEEKQPEPKIEK